MVSPGAAGLFQRAILESGPFPHVQTLAEAEVRGKELATRFARYRVVKLKAIV